jgi:hypothetical protein
MSLANAIVLFVLDRCIFLFEQMSFFKWRAGVCRGANSSSGPHKIGEYQEGGFYKQTFAEVRT